jgi:phage shock protein C
MTQNETLTAPITDTTGTTDATRPIQPSPSSPRPPFRRSRTDRMIAGVCGGAARSLGVDAALLRIALVAAILLGFGAGIVIYIACWLIVPEE